MVPFYSDKELLTDHRNASPSLMQGSFYIDGTVHMCPPHLTSSYAREHLFCIQAFSILEGAYIDRIFQEFALGGSVVFYFPAAGGFQGRLEQLLELYDGLAPHRELHISNAIENLLMMMLLESPQYRQDLSSLPENIRYPVK